MLIFPGGGYNYVVADKEGSEAAPAIWEDRAGFDEALQNWRDATDTAIAAAPATLEDAKPVLGPIWAWLIHGEQPSTLAMVGGAIIVAATALYTASARQVPPP